MHCADHSKRFFRGPPIGRVWGESRENGRSFWRHRLVFRRGGVGGRVHGIQGNLHHNLLSSLYWWACANPSRILDEEDILPVEPKTRVPAPSSPRPPPKDDDLTRLREELAKAEAQIAQLKLEKAIGKGPNESHEFHAKPLAPNMMPGHSRWCDGDLNSRCQGEDCQGGENVLSSWIV